MALQTSIAEYFNLRKRGAAEDLKRVTASNKVLILDKNAAAVDTSNDVESTARTIIYAESPPSSTKTANTVPKRIRKTPLVAARRSSASKEKKEAGQPDIRKCLWPSKAPKIEEEPTPEPTKESEPTSVNVPFHIHSLSPTKKPTTPTKAPLTPVKTEEVKGGTLPEKPLLGLATPKKDENIVAGTQEGSSDVKSEVGSVIKTKRTEAVQKSAKLADLKNRLKKFKDGFNNLKEIQERKEKLAASPKIQKFRTIELEVNVSPKKSTDAAEPKSLKSPSLLRKSLFMSPTKLPPGASTYVSPRKLFDKPPPASPSKPAYQRFYDLAVAGKPALPLPYKYRCLAETFRSVDTVVSMMYNRNENVVFNKLRSSVQQLSKRNLNESHIGQIMAVLPVAFELKREKVRTFGAQKEQYELVLKPVISEDSPNESDGKVKVSMSPSILLQRRRDFYNALLEKAKNHHEKFLSGLSPPLVIPKDKLMRWHPDFDVDSCEEILPVSLPCAPVQEKLSTAKDVLIKAKDMLSTNNRMEKALERLSSSQPPPPTSETAAATAALAKALKGIPKSLLEKVRAKQAAKTAALLTRCPEETKRRLELTRLPEISRILRNIFVLERKNVIPLPIVLEKIAQSYREVLSQDDLVQHIQLIMKSVPGWITEIMDGDKKYLRLSRDADFARITNRLQKIIADNKVDL